MRYLFFFTVFLEKDVGISLGAVVLVAVFVISSLLMVRLVRRPRHKPPPVIQVLQLDDVARNYLENIGGEFQYLKIDGAFQAYFWARQYLVNWFTIRG